MISVLINAYACNPLYGSEPGMGWNWIAMISRSCRVFVITEGEWRKEIEEAVAHLPQKENLHFFYLPVSERIRKMCWNQGDWRFYYYYRIWQKKALSLAREIISANKIDIIHQLNMIGFREPGYLWEIDGYPFVWGPIGGMNMLPEAYTEGFTLQKKLFVKLKNRINKYQIKHHSRVRKAIQKADLLISAIPEVQESLSRFYHKETPLIPETGCFLKEEESFDISRFKQTDEFNIVWVGRFIFFKYLGLAFKTIAKVKDLPGLVFHIIGDGNEEQRASYKKMAEELGIADICRWHGFIPLKKVHEQMMNSQLFFFTSISEATSTVIMEALQNNLPVFCFNTCGYGVIVDDTVGRKIELTNPEQSADEFAAEIRSFYKQRDLLVDCATNTKQKTIEMSWDVKREKIMELYEKLLQP